MKNDYNPMQVVEKATGNTITIKGSHFDESLHELPKVELPKVVEVEAPKVEKPKKTKKKTK